MRTSSSPGKDIEVLEEVHDRDTVLVPYGWHGPCVAAPGFDMYYLNVMAGPGAERAWKISDHPDQAWVREHLGVPRGRPSTDPVGCHHIATSGCSARRPTPDSRSDRTGVTPTPSRRLRLVIQDHHRYRPGLLGSLVPQRPRTAAGQPVPARGG